MKIYLVRHGETDWNLLGHIQGQNDIPLNENGRQQARELGEALAAREIWAAAVYTSPKKRAAETAEIVSRKLGLACYPTAGLEEISFGVWEGHTWDEVKKLYPDYYQEWRVNRRVIKTPEGESYQELLDRTVNALRMISGQGIEDVIVVTHSAVIMTLRCWLGGDPFEEMVKRYQIGNAAIVEVEARELWQKETTD